MPPASSRSAQAAATTAGRSKATVSKKSGQVTNASKRKSIATDSALLQGSSDEDGEGPDDHEEEQELSSQKTSAGHASGKVKTSSRSTKAHVPAVPSATSASPRRSTRLSGEGISPQQQQQSSIGSAKDLSSQGSHNNRATSTSKSQSTVPNKRKAPSSTNTGNAIGNTHPTPPETDSDTAKGRSASSSQRKVPARSPSPSSKAKKAKVASGEGRQTTRVRLRSHML